MTVFHICKFSLPTSSIWPSWPWSFLFPWSVEGSCMRPPGFDPVQLRLPCWPRPEANHPWDGSVAEMPWDARLVTGSWGQLPCSGFVVREGGLRGAGRVPRQLQAAPPRSRGSSSPQSRALVTVPRRHPAACLAAAFPRSALPFRPSARHSWQTTPWSSRHREGPGHSRHTPPAWWWRWFGSSLAPGPCWGRSLSRRVSGAERAAACSGDAALRSACYCFVSEAPRLRSFPQPLSRVVKIIEPDVFSVPDLTG